MYDPFALAIIALALDVIIGDPHAWYRRVPHPVALLGRWIERLDARFNNDAEPDSVRDTRGVGVTLGVTMAAAGAGALIHLALFAAIPNAYVAGFVEAAVASVLIACRGLLDHVRAVAGALQDGDLAGARRAVARVVGRDPDELNEPDVARAAVESLAENFSDAVVAPLFWFVLLGLPGLCACKAINTLDSMIGHRDERHGAFGRAAARLDTAMNWLPARLSALIFAGGALGTPEANAGEALRVAWRDAPRHRSVNAGWPEAALAGALGFALAGPRRYQGSDVHDAWMGGEDGRSALGARDVLIALRLYLTATMALAALLLACWVALKVLT